MVHSIVDMSILIIVQPSGLHWQKPGINTFLTPVYFRIRCTAAVVVCKTVQDCLIRLNIGEKGRTLGYNEN